MNYVRQVCSKYDFTNRINQNGNSGLKLYLSLISIKYHEFIVNWRLILLIYMVKMDSDSLESAKMIKMFPWLRFSLNLIHFKKKCEFFYAQSKFIHFYDIICECLFIFHPICAVCIVQHSFCEKMRYVF